MDISPKYEPKPKYDWWCCSCQEKKTLKVEVVVKRCHVRLNIIPRPPRPPTKFRMRNFTILNHSNPISLTESTTTIIRQDGSPAQQWKGYLILRDSLQPHSSSMVEDHAQASRRANLPSGKEGRNSFSNRCHPPRLPWNCPSQGCYR